MLDALKAKTQKDIETLQAKINRNQELINKRSRKTLDVIDADRKQMEALEKDLADLNRLSESDTTTTTETPTESTDTVNGGEHPETNADNKRRKFF